LGVDSILVLVSLKIISNTADNEEASKVPKANTSERVVCLVFLAVYLKINHSKLTKDSVKKMTNSKTGVLSRKISKKRKRQEKTYILEGIIYDEKAPLAMINGRMVKEKDKIGNLEVMEISPNSVKLLNLEDKTILTLSF